MNMNRVTSKNSVATFEPSNNFLVILILFSVSFCGYAQSENPSSNDKYAPQTVQIKAKAGDDFMLFADYFSGDKRSGGVIVLHDCENDRRSYRILANSLAQLGLHTLLMDLRGYGESVSHAYSKEEAQIKSSDLVSYQSEMALITANWPNDLMSAYQFLVKKIDKSKGISVVSSGCSGAYAVNLADKIQLNSMVMLTPEISYSDKERYKNLVDIPNFFITSSNHQDSYETVQELFSWNGSKRSKVQIFKGNDHNYQLISHKNNLVNDIALWIKSNLR
jgi:alpha/beta superfamily hydrolase